MKQRYLRFLRIFVSVVFLLLISLVFVDVREWISPAWADRILFLQFVPSIVRFITLPALAAAGFAIVLILTALFGRVYCSFLCPLGVFQDVFAWLARKVRLKKRYKYKEARNYLRYPLLALVVVSLLFGSIYALSLLDPYSIFGRIFSDLARPGILMVNNGMAGLLERFDKYFLYRVNMQLITWHTVLIPVTTLVLILWLSLFYGRLFCNAICPVGTVLGLLSRLSVYKIRMNAVMCTQCGKCSFSCKSSCINIKKLEVDFSRCVGCCDCISVCPENSIGYAATSIQKQEETTNTSKRDFIGKTLVYGLALAGISKKSFAVVAADRPAGRIPNKISHPVSPPGSVSLSHFNDRCISCHLCVTACPTGVLQPSFLQYGFTGMMQPHMDYSVEYCNFECVKCGAVCPTGAILPLTVEDKKLEQNGQVNFILEKCIVYTDNTSCGSCSEHCPTQAVKMVPYKDALTIPETDKEICIGCGACEFACPVKPHTAIFVDGNAVHQVAKKPRIEELKVETEDAFPF
jgi:ferredoxin